MASLPFGVLAPSLIGCYGQMEVKLKNPHDNFCEAWSEDSVLSLVEIRQSA